MITSLFGDTPACIQAENASNSLKGTKSRDISVGTVTGHLNAVRIHKQAVRCIDRIQDRLLSCSADGTWFISQNGRFIGYKQDHALNCVKTLSEHTFVTGSDNGVVKLWDTRLNRSQKSFTMGDWITQFYMDTELYCACGDGRLAVWDMRREPLVLDSIDDELLCVNKHNNQLVVGTGEGHLLFYNKDLEVVNRITHEESITQLVVFDDLYYASTDGCVRSLKSGVIARQSTPIEHMLLHKDTLLTASDYEIKTWQLKKQDFFNDFD